MHEGSVRRRSTRLALATIVIVASLGSASAVGMKGAARRTARRTPAYRKGELLVKFKPEHRLPAARLFRNGTPFAAYSGTDGLDALHRRYHVSDIQPLLPSRPRNSGARIGGDDLSAVEWVQREQGIRSRFARRAHRADGRRRLPDLSLVYRLRVPPETDIAALAADYASDPAVEYAEPSYTYTLAFTPDDPLFQSSGSWGQDFPDLWGLRSIQAESAWDLSTGVGVTVAVLDTGVNVNLRDIAANVWTNPGEIAANGIDDDNNGFVDDLHGWNFLSSSPDVGDVIGHGTHVAGTVAAVGNNGIGVLGVAWQAHVMPLNIFSNLGETDSALIAAGLLYAVGNGADVVNMSFGGPGDSFLVRDAVDYAAAHGVVLVAAAGNDADDVGAFSPANLDAVIAVAAVDHLDQPASFSNWGGKIEVAAPGGGDAGRARQEPSSSVLSLASSNGCSGSGACVIDPHLVLAAQSGGQIDFFLRLAGTSMAAPHVAGTAALILSRHPEFTSEQVRQALRAGADDLGPSGRDARYGFGRLNAARSVALDKVAVARLEAPKPLSRFHGEAIDIKGTALDPGSGPASWRLLLGAQGQSLNVLAAATGDVSSGTLASLDTAKLARGNYLLRLEVSGANGAVATDTLPFTCLATRPYLRQISDEHGRPRLSHDAWSHDGNTLVWTSEPAVGSFRVVATDLPTASDRSISEFQFGLDTSPVFTPLPAVLSDDGHTLAFAAPQDLSSTRTDTANRNFQLFVVDPQSTSLQPVSHVTGGGPFSFGELAITPDGSRIVFPSTLDLDPLGDNTDGSTELFYWDRSGAAFHQVTDTATQALSMAAISADGNRIAFVSSADLDPTVGNSVQANQVFVHDVSAGRTRQLTRMPGPSAGGARLNNELAIAPDGSHIAASIDTPAGGAGSGQRSIVLVDAVTGLTSTLVTTPLSDPAPSDVQFSKDGSRLLFMAAIGADGSFPPLNRAPNPALFQYALMSGTVRRLTPLASFIAAAADGRVALQAQPAPFDPEGLNPGGFEQIYVLDPDTNGGLLWLSHGVFTRGRAGRDTFRLQGQLLQPSGGPLDPGANDVSLTLLAADGQLLRATLPAGSMTRGASGWSFHDATAELVRLTLTTTDGTHYTFSAAGTQSALFAAATPYLTVEIDVGAATFSNAQRFRIRGRRMLFP